MDKLKKFCKDNQEIIAIGTGVALYVGAVVWFVKYADGCSLVGTETTISDTEMITKEIYKNGKEIIHTTLKV